MRDRSKEYWTLICKQMSNMLLKIAADMRRLITWMPRSPLTTTLRMLSLSWCSQPFCMCCTLCTQSEDSREKGNKCMKEEKYIEAMLHYTHALKRNPNNAYLFSNRSLAFLHMQQFCLALEDAKAAIQLTPAWPKVKFLSALWYIAHISPNSTWLDTSQHDTFDICLSS